MYKLSYHPHTKLQVPQKMTFYCLKLARLPRKAFKHRCSAKVPIVPRAGRVRQRLSWRRRLRGMGDAHGRVACETRRFICILLQFFFYYKLFYCVH